MRSHTARLSAAATVVTVAATAVGCGADPSAGPPSAASPSAASPSTDAASGTVSSTPSGTPAAARPALRLKADSVGSVCFDHPVGGLGFYDAQWKARDDVDSVRFRLAGATGVRLIGTPLSVAPRVAGGPIVYSGSFIWFRPGLLARVPSLRWAQRVDANTIAPRAGEDGLLLLHLRFAPSTRRGDQVAHLGDVVATYRTADGVRATARAPLKETFAFAKRC